MKTVTSGSPYAVVGDVVAYQYVVSNTGNVTLTAPITVSDDKIAAVSCPALPAGGLAPGASITCTGSYTITQGDIDAGSVTNVASASDGTTTSADATATATGPTAAPALTLVKTVTSGSPYAVVGDVVAYQYVVSNTGNVTLTAPITVSDDKIAAVSCPALPAGGLAPGASITCTGSYTITQGDIDAGSVTNVASASDGTTTSADATATATGPTAAPALTLVKTVTSGSPYAVVGDVVAYQYVVSNTGNVTLTAPITVSDDKIAAVSCPALPAGGLAPGASITCTGSYTITQGDIDAGSVTNVASASDGTTTSADATATATGPTAAPALTLVKTVTSGSPYAVVGDVVAYQYVVSNTGNVTLTAPITVSDDKIAAVSCPALPAGGLAPGRPSPARAATRSRRVTSMPVR